MTREFENLAARAALPDALRALLEAHPRETWGVGRPLGGLTTFWLERHLMFRGLLARLGGETEALLDRRRDGLGAWARTAQVFAGELHGHHGIEDAHYFPALAAREPRLAEGFALLDRDHQALDAALQGFVDATNAVLRAAAAQSVDAKALEVEFGGYLDMLGRFEPLLDRHLIDEEDLIVPILIRHGEEWLG